MRRNDHRTLWDALSDGPAEHGRCFFGAGANASLDELAAGSSLGGRLEELRGRSVLVAARDQLATALALIEIDGIARRLVLCPPDLPLEHLPAIMATAEVDAIVSDRSDLGPEASSIEHFVTPTEQLEPSAFDRRESLPTEWILFTSGTTGVPKLVVHTLETLAGAIRPGGRLAGPAIWCTFYDIRRFGGLQIFLRAVLGGGSLVLSSPDEPIGDFLARAGAREVTRITGTPSHWRRALMSPAARKVDPQYARLSGEIADQAVLDNLQACYGRAQVSHAFASTEAGVAFEVNDGLAGFPATLLGRQESGVEMKVQDDSLRIRSPRMALRYLGEQADPLVDRDGYLDTGDMLEQRDGRCYFVGRRGGIINVGGLKIHPEEVEAVINRHPRVRMSLVKARKNPITGALVVADVVLDGADGANQMPDELKSEILAACRSTLAPHKVPATIRVVPSLSITPAGKVARSDA
jgi:acyl-coenzyme A synthetase/AMP-(fatty) acid ligase